MTKIRPYLCVVCFALLAACAPSQGLAPGSEMPSLERTRPNLANSSWLLVRFGDDAVLANTEITLAFDETASRASGRAGCNSYSAGVLTDDGLRFLNPISTLMACAPEIMEQEQRFFQALQGVTDYALEGDTLTLTGEEPLHFRAAQAAEEDAALEGEWLLETLTLSEDATVMLVTDAAATLSVDNEAATLSGSTGCNRYSAPFAKDGDLLRVGGVITTRMACDEARMRQEANFIRILESVHSFRLDGGRLVLSGDAGELTFVPQR